ncbi:MAG: hypothetical protein JO223_24585 [Hyphomicrobiales bacterium]|nr:hypothetical protein [Hyphomicrobiales bacterium]MBV8441528.1 hypothetical protein [Hyphomicrobiales bacterium]
MTRCLLCIQGALCVLAAIPTLAKEPAAPPEYPPGLFENSPVVGSQPAAPTPDAPVTSPTWDDCADIASRVFRSLAEVKAAHARCDDRPDPSEPD